MTTPKTFDLIVEGGYDENYRPRPHLYEFNSLPWDGDSPPELIVLPDGAHLIKIGRYLSAGDRYCYRVAKPVHLKPTGWAKEPFRFE
jgi:hypothetical protein